LKLNLVHLADDDDDNGNHMIMI